MAKVWTTHGAVDRELLKVEDVITETETTRAIATEWRLDGELVRRDVAVSVFMGHLVSAEQGG